LIAHAKSSQKQKKKHLQSESKRALKRSNGAKYVDKNHTNKNEM